MDGTVIVGVVGSVATTITAIAGFRFNNTRAREDRKASDARAKDDRDAARELAKDAQSHERFLTLDRDNREAAARRDARAYDERRDVYRRLIGWALTEVNHIQLAGFGGLPERMSEAEWALLFADVRLFCSREVYEAFEAFDTEARNFQRGRDTLEQLAARHLSEKFYAGSLEKQEKIRAAAVSAFETLSTAMTTELASL